MPGENSPANELASQEIEYGPNESPPDKDLLKKQPMIRHLINREGIYFSINFMVDRNILQNCIVKFSKVRTYKNEGRRNYRLTPPSESPMLKFESRFENGNLWKAVKVTDNEYNLVLLHDF